MTDQDTLAPAKPKTERKRLYALPLSCPPRGLSRPESASYVGVSITLFDEMVRDRRMPPAKRINGRLVWDRFKLDEAFSAIPDGDTEAGANAMDIALAEFGRAVEAQPQVPRRGRGSPR